MDTDLERDQDEPGILRSRAYFNSLIKEEINKGIKPSRIVLGGFSQGGCMSIFTGITQNQKLGGIFGLSCYLLLGPKIQGLIPENFPNKQTPFFIAHGTDDEVVQHKFGEISAERLKAMDVPVEFHSYPWVAASVFLSYFFFCSSSSNGGSNILIHLLIANLDIPPIHSRFRI